MHGVGHATGAGGEWDEKGGLGVGVGRAVGAPEQDRSVAVRAAQVVKQALAARAVGLDVPDVQAELVVAVVVLVVAVLAAAAGET